MQIYGKLPVLGVKIWFGEFKGREYTRQPCYCEANGLVWGRAGGGGREPGRAGIAEARIAAGLRRAPRDPTPCRSARATAAPAARSYNQAQPAAERASERAPGPGEARLWAGEKFLTSGRSS